MKPGNQTEYSKASLTLRHQHTWKEGIDPLDPDTLLVDLKQPRHIGAGRDILVVLLNVTNPAAGIHAINVETRDPLGNPIEIVAPISLSTSARGDIEEVIAGTGLTGGGSAGAVTLDVNTSQIQVRVNGGVLCEADDNSGGNVTNVTASSPLTSSGGATPNISLPTTCTSRRTARSCSPRRARQSRSPSELGNRVSGNRVID